MASATYGPKIVIVGAGPVGALAGLYAAKRGFEVEIYEGRSDLTVPTAVPLNFTKSINLTLSERGLRALRNSDDQALYDDIINETVPVHSRMVHGVDRLKRSTARSAKYDVHGECLRVVDRSGLNVRILEALEEHPNVQVFYERKLISCNFTEKYAIFETKATNAFLPTGSSLERQHDGRQETVKVNFDLLIGADGAHSMTRQCISKVSKMNIAQRWIDVLWCEFDIKADENGDSKLSHEHLHIWPQDECMFIALPDKGSTFTCNLFGPPEQFAALEADPESIVPFFEKSFPGVLPDLIKPDELVRMFKTNHHLPLLDIRCSPYHYGDSCVIIGDAAHAMVPFYGQGLNTGFEDVQLLFQEFLNNKVWDNVKKEIVPQNKNANVLEAYSKFRMPDIHTINDLALENYEDMRIGVNSSLVAAVKLFEETMSWYFPSLGWSTLYRRVAFTAERYSIAKSKSQRQKTILARMFYLGAMALGIRLLMLFRFMI